VMNRTMDDVLQVAKGFEMSEASVRTWLYTMKSGRTRFKTVVPFARLDKMNAAAKRIDDEREFNLNVLYAAMGVLLGLVIDGITVFILGKNIDRIWFPSTLILPGLIGSFAWIPFYAMRRKKNVRLQEAVIKVTEDALLGWLKARYNVAVYDAEIDALAYLMTVKVPDGLFNDTFGNTWRLKQNKDTHEYSLEAHWLLHKNTHTAN
jgi:hypothetical protein